MTETVFIAWTRFQRRNESIARRLGYQVFYAPPTGQGPKKLISYIAQLHRTISIIRSHKAETVWIQLPPTFLPHFLLAYRQLSKTKFRLIADCHNRVLRPFWSKMPALSWVLNKMDLVIVHNEEAEHLARKLGIKASVLAVLEDPPAELIRGVDIELPYNSVLVPCSFNPDEPIHALLDAARMLPNVEFYITGSKEKARRLGYVSAAPKNVRFTDFLSRDDYESIFRSAGVILGLTTVDGVQLSVASEAIGAEKPLILSDTGLLRTMFGDAAIFSANTPQGISAAVQSALLDKQGMANQTVRLKAKRSAKWQEDVQSILEKALAPL